MKDMAEQIYDELNAQVVRLLQHSLNQTSRIVELETQLQAEKVRADKADAMLKARDA